MDNTKPTTPAEAQPEAKEVKHETVGEALTSKKEVETKMVPEAAFLELKKEFKAATKELKSLKERAEQGDSDADMSDDIESLAEEHNIDPKFLKKLTKAIRKGAEVEAEEKIERRLKPLEAEKEAERIDRLFNKHFSQALEDMPEYNDIVNKRVIKALSLDPDNKDKTFKQLIEEAYSPAIKGRKSLESTTNRADTTLGETVDIARMKSDKDYYAKVMENPTLKAEYNKDLIKRLRL